LEGESEPDFNTLSLHSPPRTDKERDMAARSDISADSIERNNAGGVTGGERFERAQARWLEDMRARGVKIVQVTYPRTANNDKELSVVRGELLEVRLKPNQKKKLSQLSRSGNVPRRCGSRMTRPSPPGNLSRRVLRLKQNETFFFVLKTVNSSESV